MPRVCVCVCGHTNQSPVYIWHLVYCSSTFNPLKQAAYFLQLSEGVILSRERRGWEKDRQEVGAGRVGTKKVLWTLREKSTQLERHREKKVQGCSQKQTTNLQNISSAFFLMLHMCFRVRGRRMDLTVLILLAMLLCSSCLSELGVRDPDVEEEEKAALKSSFSTSGIPVPLGHLSRSGQLDTQLETPQSPLPFLRVSSHQPARRG